MDSVLLPYCARNCLRKLTIKRLEKFKMKKLVNMNADTSETIKDRELGLQIKIP